MHGELHLRWHGPTVGAGAVQSPLDAVPVVLQHGPAEATRASVVPPSVTSRPDPARTAEDERRLRALLAAFRGRVPGPIGDALDREPEKP